MRRPYDWSLAAFALACLTGAASAMDSPSSGNGLEDGAWVLVQLSGEAVLQDRPPTLRLSQGRAQGSDGCNRFTGAYQADGERFRIAGDIASTRMACPEPVMKLAAGFIAALTGARTARIENGQLVLADEGGRALATLAPQSQDLAGTAWLVTSYNNGKQAVVSVLRDSLLTIGFAADGTIGGSGGCNRYTGTYSSSGTTIDIAQLAATRKLCTGPEGVMEQELAFLKALHSAASVRVEGERLELRTADGAIAVTAVQSANEGSGRD